jgi:hypothetical protein
MNEQSTANLEAETPRQEDETPKPAKKKIFAKDFNIVRLEKRVTATFSTWPSDKDFFSRSD